LGGISAIALGNWVRTDLVPSSCDIDVADFIRRGYDDLMVAMSSGSWLHAGVDNGTIATFTQNVWYDQTRTRSSCEWFGRE
jgi:hypothetical protein